ncbi:MAG TPA: hypothetical protein PKD09_09515 [Aggregatilinea sp.]|uniref:hypothetical protein n=1 Tax=Aggregatilinea sp. TaxID=2806333 RepID=UPI002C88F699|nr:hypothetical protein [Aggregatilinea sp.]HML21875.1 hypothetical protein [Aggregatilinea sp.]
MTEKPFYKSKKFIYAACTFVAALILYLLQLASPDMTQDQIELLNQMILMVLIMGSLLLTGHTITDVTAVWVNRPQTKPLGEAAHDLIDAVTGGDDVIEQPYYADYLAYRDKAWSAGMAALSYKDWFDAQKPNEGLPIAEPTA